MGKGEQGKKEKVVRSSVAPLTLFPLTLIPIPPFALFPYSPLPQFPYSPANICDAISSFQRVKGFPHVQKNDLDVLNMDNDSGKAGPGGDLLCSRRWESVWQFRRTGF